MQSVREVLDFCSKYLPNLGKGPKFLEELMAFYSKEIIYSDPEIDEGIVGKDAVRVHLGKMLLRMMGSKWKVEEAYPIHNGFAVKFSVSFLVDQVPKTLRGMQIIELHAGQIVRQDCFYDRSVVRLFP